MFKQNFTGVGLRLRLHFASVYVTLSQKRLTKYIQLPSRSGLRKSASVHKVFKQTAFFVYMSFFEIFQ